MIEKSQLQAYLEERLPDELAMLRQMVEINTFTENKTGVDALGQLTAAYFAPLGFKAQFVPAVDGRFGHHLVLIRAGSSGRVIGCVSHLDTVFPADEELANDFRWLPVEVDGEQRIHGPGTVDIKGGTVMIHLVLSALQAFAPDLFEQITWKILLNAAEERLQEDFGALCRSELPAESTAACLVFEGGQLRDGVLPLVTQRKGRGEYKITVTGRAAHAGTNHQRGANAVIQLAEIVRAIAGLTDYKRELTFNVGVFHGGTVVNRVPHEATAEVEFRTFDPGTFQEALISMQSVMGYSTIGSYTQDFHCDTIIERVGMVRPWPENEGSQAVFAVWADAAAAVGFTAEPEARGGLSDGNFLWDHVPTLDGLGPGGGWAHSSERSADGSKQQEYVVVDTFVPKAMVNVMAIVKMIEMNDE